MNAQNINELEIKYQDITAIYDMSEELLDTAVKAADSQAQFELIEPLVEVLADSADILSEEYIVLIEGKPARKQAAKTKIEGALRKAYIALNEFSTRAKDTKNAAHVVVKKIRDQLGKVISHFVGFVSLSLDRIMQKAEVESLKAQHASIALMMHQLSQTSV